MKILKLNMLVKFYVPCNKKGYTTTNYNAR